VLRFLTQQGSQFTNIPLAPITSKNDIAPLHLIYNELVMHGFDSFSECILDGFAAAGASGYVSSKAPFEAQSHRSINENAVPEKVAYSARAQKP
jgi:hypothetical protein